eukprot:Platyproteum_vivax@DN2497_c0_g1_i1.p1
MAIPHTGTLGTGNFNQYSNYQQQGYGQSFYGQQAGYGGYGQAGYGTAAYPTASQPMGTATLAGYGGYNMQQPYTQSFYSQGYQQPPTQSFMMPHTASFVPPQNAAPYGSFYQQGSFYDFSHGGVPPIQSMYAGQQSFVQPTRGVQDSTARSIPKEEAARRTNKEAVLVIKNVVDIPKAYGDLGTGRYQVVAWCRMEDASDIAVKKGYCTQLINATTSASGDTRKEDVNFNFAKIRVPWDGEEVIQIKVFTDETVKTFQKTDLLGTLALSLQDPDSKTMLAYPIAGPHKEVRGYMYCTAEIVPVNQAATTPAPRVEKKERPAQKPKGDEPWCFCL